MYRDVNHRYSTQLIWGESEVMRRMRSLVEKVCVEWEILLSVFYVDVLEIGFCNHSPWEHILHSICSSTDCKYLREQEKMFLSSGFQEIRSSGCNDGWFLYVCLRSLQDLNKPADCSLKKDSYRNYSNNFNMQVLRPQQRSVVLFDNVTKCPKGNLCSRVWEHWPSCNYPWSNCSP